MSELREAASGQGCGALLKASELAGGEIGARRLRREDDALLSGAGCFVDDRSPAGCLHLAFARSPFPHAAIRSLDIEAARKSPGVVTIVTASDLEALGPLPVNRTMFDAQVPRRPLLARHDVRYVGEPIVAVVAVSIEAARDAVDRIALDFDDGSAVIDMKEGAESFLKQWFCGDVAAAFREADEVVSVRLTEPRVAASPLESRATLAAWDEAKDDLTVWSSTQTPHRLRADLADLLGIDRCRVRVVAADVGGAFGSKASIYPEDVVVAWAARHVRRPVKWIATRSEDLISATHGRGAVLEGELAVRRDGTLLGLRASVTFPLGAWLPYSALVPAWNAGRILPGPYAVPNVHITSRGVLTDTAPLGIYRGAGRPEASLLIERLVDDAARALGMDAAELRYRNLVPAEAFPFRTPTGQVLDSGDYCGLLERALDLAGYADLREERQRRRARGELYGIGIALYLEPCGQGSESANVKIEQGTRAHVACGTSPQGQGQATAFAQIASDVLSFPIENIEIVQGDTAAAPAGVGALASRSTAIGGSAIAEAARQARERFAAGDALPIEVSVNYVAPGEAWSAGCCIAAVSIDAETGELRVERFAFTDDAGVVVNPMLVEGQLTGGFAQGLGQVLMERIVHDENGQVLTGSLMDYALPRASDVPPLLLAELNTRSTANTLGSKGVGESGAIGTPAALLNAALDALSVRGVRGIDMPLTSETIWRALKKESFDEISED